MNQSKTFCPLLFNGIHINTLGKVASCCMMEASYGDLRVDKLENILNNIKHKTIKDRALKGIKDPACQKCFKLEEDPNTYDFSPRINALKYSENWMNDINAFKLEYLDLRWQNTCNLACIMCSMVYSSKWTKESTGFQRFLLEITDETYNHIFSDIKCIKEVYLAGGEPLQMTENIKLLNQLLEKNSTVQIRLNTNLSVIGTEVYRLLNKFPKENIHWTVSIDGELDMYEYIRWPGKWQQIYHNLIELVNEYENVYIDILVNILNYKNVFLLAEDVLIHDLNLDPNRIKFSALTYPNELDVRNYSDEILEKIVKDIKLFINRHDKNNIMVSSAQGLISHINNKDFIKNIDKTHEFLLKLDKRRNTNYKDLRTYLNE